MWSFWVMTTSWDTYVVLSTDSTMVMVYGCVPHLPSWAVVSQSWLFVSPPSWCQREANLRLFPWRSELQWQLKVSVLRIRTCRCSRVVSRFQLLVRNTYATWWCPEGTFFCYSSCRPQTATACWTKNLLTVFPTYASFAYQIVIMDNFLCGFKIHTRTTLPPASSTTQPRNFSIHSIPKAPGCLLLRITSHANTRKWRMLIPIDDYPTSWLFKSQVRWPFCICLRVPGGSWWRIFWELGAHDRWKQCGQRLPASEQEMQSMQWTELFQQ